MASSHSLSPLPEMPLLPITSEDTVAACRNLKVSENDIFVCSYPKSGTTWTQNLVCRLLAADIGMQLPDDWHLSHSAPFYEVDRYWEHNKKDNDKDGRELVSSSRVPEDTPIQKINDQTTTTTTYYRVFNTHLRPDQLPPNAKCVYVVRDPLDVLASFYYHLVNMAPDDGGYEGTPQEFCKEFIEGTILYGKWQDHLEAWIGHVYDKKQQKILLLHYDDMIENLEREATKLARFLAGDEDDVQSVIEAVVPQCTFSAMKQERWRYTPRSVAWKKDHKTGRPYEDFIRTGKIGNGKTFFETYASKDLKQEWNSILHTTRVRWNMAKVDTGIIKRYLGDDD